VTGVILGGGFINLLDQTGQGVADFAREDHGDRVAPVSSDEARLLAGSLTRDVQRVERHNVAAAGLRTGLQVVRSHRAADNECGYQWRSYNNSMSHCGINLLMARNPRDDSNIVEVGVGNAKRKRRLSCEMVGSAVRTTS
jgi:hypothetical protein